MKKIFSFLICFTLVFSSISFVGEEKIYAFEGTTMTKLYSLVEQFPHSKYWNRSGKNNNTNSYTSTPCSCHRGCSWNKNCQCNVFDNAIQCMGYAYKIAYEITGKSARDFEKSMYLDAKKLRVGDVIRYKNNTHSIAVTGVNGDEISFTDANWTGKCQIRWSRMKLSDIKGFSYVLHLSGNERTNANLNFYREEPTAEKSNMEIWKNSSDSNFNVRKSHSTSADWIFSIPPGATFFVTDHYSDGDYLWGKVEYFGQKGWSALNWSDYKGINGSLEAPDFIYSLPSYPISDAVLYWKKVKGADYYIVKIFDEKGNTVKKYTSEAACCRIRLSEAGKYSAKVYAKNRSHSGWYVGGSMVIFTLKDNPPVYVEDFSLPASVKVKIGTDLQLKISDYGKNVSYPFFLFSSSNSRIASVSAEGRITGKACGQTVITVRALDKNKVSKKIKVNVAPGNITELKYTLSSSKESLKLIWKRSEGATEYHIYEYKNGEYKKAAETKSLNYSIKNLKRNKTYYYKVLPVYVKGNIKINGSYSPRVKISL